MKIVLTEFQCHLIYQKNIRKAGFFQENRLNDWQNCAIATVFYSQLLTALIRFFIFSVLGFFDVLTSLESWVSFCLNSRISPNKNQQRNEKKTVQFFSVALFW